MIKQKFNNELENESKELFSKKSKEEFEEMVAQYLKKNGMSDDDKSQFRYLPFSESNLDGLFDNPLSAEKIDFKLHPEKQWHKSITLIGNEPVVLEWKEQEIETSPKCNRKR